MRPGGFRRRWRSWPLSPGSPPHRLRRRRRDGGAGAPLRESAGRRRGIHAWAAGENGDLLVISDGGASWKRQRFYLPQRAVEVTFSDPQTGWLVTDEGTVLTTADGGAGWTVVEKVELDVKAIAATDYRTAGSSAMPSARRRVASAVLRTRTAARRGRGLRLATPCSLTSPSLTAGMACPSRWTGSGAPGTAAAPGRLRKRFPMTC